MNSENAWVTGKQSHRPIENRYCYLSQNRLKILMLSPESYFVISCEDKQTACLPDNTTNVTHLKAPENVPRHSGRQVERQAVRQTKLRLKKP